MVQNVLSKMKKMKTERESGGGFLNSVFILCLNYVIAMITKRSKGYVPYLYMQNKVKNKTLY